MTAEHNVYGLWMYDCSLHSYPPKYAEATAQPMSGSSLTAFIAELERVRTGYPRIWKDAGALKKRAPWSVPHLPPHVYEQPPCTVP